MSLFAELKRRNVFRVAIAYLIAAWFVLQVSELVLDAIEAPAWVIKVFLLLFGIGFPFALLFSWAYELTPEGLKREQDVDRDVSVTQSTGRKLDQITIVIAVALVIFIAVDRAYLSSSDQQTSESVAAAVAEKSIAVLAFEDLSPEGDQEYFADGLSEELLNVLAQLPGLQVAGRTSSFAFKGQNRDLREIGEILNVAHILEGSVRKAGNRIRVTAQLINASTGFHLYSESYDRDLTDVFAVQDEIAAAISEALRTELIGSETKRVAETSIDAYDLYLAARQKIYTRDKTEMTEASQLLDQALGIDSEYAPALAQKALVLILLSDGIGSYGDIPEDEAAAAARPLVDKAIAIDPGLAEAHAISGLVMESEKDTSMAEWTKTYEHALALNPNLDNTRLWLSSAYSSAGRNDEARTLGESIVERDPLFGPAFNNLIIEYMRTQDVDLANRLIGRMERIVGETAEVNQAWGTVAVEQGESARAIRYLKRGYDEYPGATINRLLYCQALWQIGELDTIIDVGDELWRISAFDLLGRHDEAHAFVEELDPNTEFNFDLFIALNHFVHDGKYDEAVNYVERHFDSLDSLMSQFRRPDGSNSSYMDMLAFSYLQEGMLAEFEKLTAALEIAIEQQRAAGSVGWDLWGGQADLAALTGDDEGALRHLQAIADSGGIGVFLKRQRIFEHLTDNPQFRKIDAALIKRANDERGKLGLDPYLAPVLSN